MTPERLVQNQALNPGDDLWILPDKNSSGWSQKMDWYLNFQVTKARAHAPQKLSSQLQAIVQEEELGLKEVVIDSEAPLFVASAKNLPNQNTIEVIFHGQEEEWLRQIEQIWIRLQKPKTRIFLPRGFSEDLVKKFCAKNFTAVRVNYVVDTQDFYS